MMVIMMTDAERFELYIAWRRFRTEMWKHHPLLRFARWFVPKLSRALAAL